MGLAGAGAHVYLLGRSKEKAAARIAKIEAAGGTASFLPSEATKLLASTGVRVEELEGIVRSVTFRAVRTVGVVTE